MESSTISCRLKITTSTLPLLNLSSNSFESSFMERGLRLLQFQESMKNLRELTVQCSVMLSLRYRFFWIHNTCLGVISLRNNSMAFCLNSAPIGSFHRLNMVKNPDSCFLPTYNSSWPKYSLHIRLPKGLHTTYLTISICLRLLLKVFQRLRFY